MKKANVIILLVASLALAACTQTKEDMLIGTWHLDRAVETVTGSGYQTDSELPGYDDYTMDFVKEGYCAVTVRGTCTIYMWYLVGDNTLLLELDNDIEDYTIVELTRKRLVYSDTYSVRDTATDGITFYTYTFEYSKQ